jgi:hypothetical protein
VAMSEANRPIPLAALVGIRHKTTGALGRAIEPCENFERDEEVGIRQRSPMRDFMKGVC